MTGAAVLRRLSSFVPESGIRSQRRPEPKVSLRGREGVDGAVATGSRVLIVLTLP